MSEPFLAEIKIVGFTFAPRGYHSMPAINGNAQETDSGGALPAAAESKTYHPPARVRQINLEKSTIGNAGGGIAHNNVQPYLTLNFIIALVGVYPTRN